MSERYRDNDDDNGDEDEEEEDRREDDEEEQEEDGPIIDSDHPLRAALPLIPLSLTTTTPSTTPMENNGNRTNRIAYILLVTFCVTGTLGSALFLLVHRHNEGRRDGSFFRNHSTNRNYNSNYNQHHQQGQDSMSSIARQYEASNDHNRVDVLSDSHLPPGLMELGLYDPAVDFVNEIGISPPYWTLATEQHYKNNDKKQKSWTTKTTPNKDTVVPSETTTESTWGPCYPDPSIRHWTAMNDPTPGATVPYEFIHDPNDIQWSGPSSIDGTCRPGFIILGAGKCGTSSLYHYLLGHPRVAPAFAKQIHYFIVRDLSPRDVWIWLLAGFLTGLTPPFTPTPIPFVSTLQYHLNKPMAWYYSWFPTAQSFLQHGALITGEASPGYLPYPKAVKSAFDRLQGQPKFIAIGRNPLTRMYSSYRYNYRSPTLQTYQAGQKRGILRDQPDEYYEPYLFSFEELIRAELKQLKKCLSVPGGFGASRTRSKWYPEKWTNAEFDKRKEQGLDPLIDLDDVCYGQPVNRTVLRPQWAELQMTHPEKFIPARNAFLIQSLIGRSLYVLPLEWWYILFDSNDILFFCTEDLNEPSKLNDLSMQLGLPSFDYTPIVDQGAFNVGTNQGYDQATPWEELESDPLLTPPKDFVPQPLASLNGSEALGPPEGGIDQEPLNDAAIPLSAELRKELLDFVHPYNERLFQLTGKRCNW